MIYNTVMIFVMLMPGLRADINKDGCVNFKDLAILAEEWLMTTDYYLEFDGSGYITVPDNINNRLGTGDFTFEFLFRCDAIPTERRWLFDNRATNAPHLEIEIRRTTGYLNMILISGGAKNCETDINVCDGEWHHCVFIADRLADTGTWYIDNVIHGVTDISTVGTMAKDKGWLIGANQAAFISAPQWFFLGGIDNFAIYPNTALDTDGIAARYNDSLTAESLGASWFSYMNDGSGTTVTDSIGGINGTISDVNNVSWQLWPMGLVKAITFEINRQYENDSDLSTALNGMYWQKAKQAENLPYAVFFLISSYVDEQLGNNKFETVDIQFSVFTDNSVDLDDAVAKLNSVYDNASLTLPGFDSLIMKQTGTYRLGYVDEAWQSIVNYELMAA